MKTIINYIVVQIGYTVLTLTSIALILYPLYGGVRENTPFDFAVTVDMLGYFASLLVVGFFQLFGYTAYCHFLRKKETE